MSSPLSADFGLLASSLTNGARGRVPNDGALFGLMVQGGARASLPRRKVESHFADLPGIVTCSLLLFKCPASSRFRDFQNADISPCHRFASRRSGAAPDRGPDRHHYAHPAGGPTLARPFDRQEARG